MEYLQTALAYAHSHAGPFIAGAVLTRPVLCADLAFKLAMKTPLKYAILANSRTINTWIDSFQAEFDKNVEAEKKADVEAKPDGTQSPVA